MRVGVLREAGFSLIELAVVLVVLSLIIGGGIVALEVGTERQQRNETERQLEEIRTALYGFAMSTGKLPCADITDPPNGEENRESGGSCASDADQGVLPWETLGLGRRDAWGDAYLYAVDPSYADDPNDGDRSSFALTDSAGLSVESSVVEPDAVTLADDVPAVVVSFGGQGRQVWDPGLPCDISLEGFSADEVANCDEDDEFVAADYRGAEAGDGRFDDIVIWLPDTILKARMVEAGRLP